MNEFLVNFHFLRPLWLLLLIPLLFIVFRLVKDKSSNTGADHFISADLLPYLSISEQQKKASRLPLVLFTLLTTLAIIALAGPVWKKLPQAIFQSDSALIIALDLSPSMRAEDNSPSRIRRAHLKIQSLLERRKEGLTALLVYAGEAHMVTPFTDDTRTISNLLTTLVPGLLPIPGSNTEMAITLAAQQLGNSGISKASLLLVTDGVSFDALDTIKSQWDSRLSLTILGLGTDAGATIPSSDGYLRDKRGEFILAKRNSDVLKELASSNNGYYLPLQADDSDIRFIEEVIEQDFSSIAATHRNTQDNFDQWHEFGPSLLLGLLPFLAFLFRRGWLLSLFITGSFITTIYPQPAQASFWEKLWNNNDQQGLNAWENEDYDKAATLFKDPQWQGSAAYKNNDFNEALNAFKNDNSAIGQYNQGNALANLGEYEQAIRAYDEALKLQPDFTEAEENKRIVEEQVQQQQQQQQQESNQKDSQEQPTESDESTESDNSEPAQNDPQGSNDLADESLEDNTQDNQQTENAETEQSDSSIDNNIPLPDDLTQEEQQAMQQWLRKIPDDPSGLLRRKFEYEFNKRRQLYQQGKWQLPDNNAHERY